MKPGKRPLRAELDLPVLAAAARDLRLADMADHIGHQDVAALGRALDRLGLALLFGQALERLVDVLVGHFGHQLLEPEPGEIGLRHVGHHLQRHLVFEIGPLFGGHSSTRGCIAGRRLRSRIASAELSCTALSNTSPRTAGP